MRSPTGLLYGLATGLLVAWMIVSVAESFQRWLLLGAALALASALFFHQRAVARSKGRRWRKTT